ncbi:MaoC family dehydratase [Phreatobacter stygius]|uniref:MaoC family dehydratase n=1 Tax=Phreatobacter stygius TaxID=1940610 RepID=A0A4D7AXX5_9HYPH|nr:MaoC family dehydratase [Phreatobacter stygius]QCI66394.1 MaoC family dehydratase [Phreatobacter stygius]
MSHVDPTFDASAHVVAPQRWFEDFQIGERYLLPSRTVTDANFAAFQTVSADNHPIHYDVEFCRAHGLPGLLAHGLQVACFTAAGAGRFPHEVSDALIAFLEQSSKFLRMVVMGDTLYPALEIAELIPQRTTGVMVMNTTIHNQKRELVLTGMHRYLLRRRPS